MSKLFNNVFNEYYKNFFQEEAPESDQIPKSPEQPAPEGVNEPSNNPQEDKSTLPDPAAQAAVGIDTLNAVIQLFQKSPAEQKNIIDQLKGIAGTNGINNTNYADAMAVVKSLLPNPTI